MNCISNYIRTIILVLCVLCTAVDSFALDALSLDSCLQLAVQNNLALQRASLNVVKAQEVSHQARSKYFPQLDAVAFGYHSLHPVFEVGIDDVPNEKAREFLNRLYDDFGAYLGLNKSLSIMHYGLSANFTLVQPVYVGGKIVAGNQLAKLGVEASQLQLDMAQRDLLLTVEENYWLIVNLESKQQTVQSVFLLLDTIHATVESAVNAGLARSNDILQVEIRRDELVAQQLQLSNGIRLAKRALCQSIGIPYSDSLQLSDTMTVDVETYLPSLDTSVLHRPETELLALQLKSEQLHRRMALADALPQVMVGGTYGYSNLLSPLSPDGHKLFLEGDQTKKLNGALGVMVRVPLTSWIETAHRLREHDASISQARLQQQDLSEQMVLQQQQAYDLVQESASLLAQYRTSLSHAKENYRLCRLNYQAGLQTISDLLQAQTLYLQSQNNLTDALIRYHMAQRTYQSLSGKR